MTLTIEQIHLLYPHFGALLLDQQHVGVAAGVARW
jgi:hypothetical protein